VTDEVGVVLRETNDADIHRKILQVVVEGK
jgi:hypothetical protein